MSAVKIISFLVISVIIIVGGYYAYKYGLKPSQCTNKAASSNVATWSWDSEKEKCFAATCKDSSYSLSVDGLSCKKKDKMMKAIGTGAFDCTDGNKYGSAIPNVKDDGCSTKCKDETTCAGYSFTGAAGAAGSCQLLDTKPTTESTKPGTCYSYDYSS